VWESDAFVETTLPLTAAPLYQQLVDLTVEVLELERELIVPEARFAEELGADSLDLVELVEAIESAFEVRIGDDELADITTIAEAYEVVSGKLA
jgi:acyl carrier protein